MKVSWPPETPAARGQETPRSFSKNFATTLAAAEHLYAMLEELFAAAAKRFGLRVELLRAVAQVESGFNPRAVSPAGAQGIMQLMPATARALGVRDPFNPAESIFAGAAYLRSLLDRFGGNEALALAAYNAGPGAVARYGGIPPFPETRAFVARVLKLSGSTLDLDAPPPVLTRSSGQQPEGETVAAGRAEEKGEEALTAEAREILAAAAVVWRYALAEYLLHATDQEEKQE